MSVEVLHAPQLAASAVMRALALNASCPSSDARFEILRATVWGIAAPSRKVHVNRVLGTALPTWQLVSERATASTETLRAELREALSTLEGAGDLLELRGGYWAPATARFVSLPEGTGYLLIGGVPSSLLPVELEAVQYHGPHRHLATIPSELATALSIEDLESWAKLPRIALGPWAREVIESLDRLPYSPTAADPFEFYMPETSRPGAPQFKRWFESASVASQKSRSFRVADGNNRAHPSVHPWNRAGHSTKPREKDG